MILDNGNELCKRSCNTFCSNLSIACGVDKFKLTLIGHSFNMRLINSAGIIYSVTFVIFNLKPSKNCYCIIKYK